MKHQSAKYLLLLLIPAFLVLFLTNTRKESTCANSISCITNLETKVENDSLGTYNGQTIVPPKINLSADTSKPKVLGEANQVGKKHIFVNLENQTLYAYEGDKLFLQAFVSTGKWSSTPTGDFKIWVKLRATRMTGGVGASYYDLPNVPYTMFFANQEIPQGRGFALHGAYWHNNFGHPMSHGCVNMRPVDAEKIFNWIDDPEISPTTITIYGQANI